MRTQINKTQPDTDTVSTVPPRQPYHQTNAAVSRKNCYKGVLSVDFRPNALHKDFIIGWSCKEHDRMT